MSLCATRLFVPPSQTKNFSRGNNLLQFTFEISGTVSNQRPSGVYLRLTRLTPKSTVMDFAHNLSGSARHDVIDKERLASSLAAGGAHSSRAYMQFKELEQLDNAIEYTKAILRFTEQDYGSYTRNLNNLALFLAMRSMRTGKMKDLKEAIDIARRLVQSTVSDDINLALHLHNLGNTLKLWFERSGEIEYLEEAIDISRRVVQSTKFDHPKWAVYLDSLGTKLGSRFERSGEKRDLEEAIAVARLVVQSTPLDHPNLKMYLSNLGNWIGSHFERSGEMKVLEEAIDIARRVVQSTSLDHSDWTTYLDNLGYWLGRRFEQGREMKDLEEAIDISQRAVESTPRDHPKLAVFLNNLWIWLGRRFEQNGEIKDLIEATDAARRAVQSTPLDHPDRVVYLNSLGNRLGRQFEQSGETKTLKEAINVARTVVYSTPLDHPNRAGYLNNLGNWLGYQFKQSREITFLEEAIDTAKRALYATSIDHPNRAGYLNSLGNWLEHRSEESGEIKDLEDASQCYLRAFYCSAATPLERVNAAAHFLSHSTELPITEKAVELGTDALALLPLVNNRNLDRTDQQFVLSHFRGITSNLCALLLSKGRIDEAIACLEQGRAVIMSRLLDDRSDITTLCQEHPELAQRYQSLLAEINAPFGNAKDDRTSYAKVMRRREAVTELDICLREIRASTGYERFLLGQTIAQMQKNICDGFVVIVNVSTIRSDAVVVGHNSSQLVPLPELSAADAMRWLSTDWNIAKRSEARQKNDKFLEYLSWLWHVCVEDTLGHVSALCKGQGPALPRVWWIGCGLGSSMPFHAAGIHAHTSQENAFSRAISSYTPSIKALGHARSNIKHVQDNQIARHRIFVALMPMTPKGANDRRRFRALRGIAKEEAMISNLVSPHLSTIVLTTPDVASVVSQLENCQMAHFACHGISDPTDPSKSGLVLQRFASDGTLEQDHLSVYRISQLRLRHAQIAYLSACSTAENKSVKLRDEMIHIVSGFQVAGFPHVVGSLWPAGDEECVNVARFFYSSLFEHGGMPDIRGRRVACTLQQAVMKIRAEDIDMPLNWAQFVHFGA
jgi:tetratricopeptide (TPR) repeat protein